MSKRTVSIIIPSYNYAHFLKKTLTSALQQQDDSFDLEVLLIDDGSTDDTRTLVQKFFPKVQYHYQENQGESVARNTGIACAKGDFLLFWMPMISYRPSICALR